MFIYHRTRTSLSSIAKIYANEPGVETMDESPTGNNIPGAYPEQHASFAMSDIEAVGQAPTAPEVNDDAAHDDLEQGSLDPDEGETVVQNVSDGANGSWIPIPYVHDPNGTT